MGFFDDVGSGFSQGWQIDKDLLSRVPFIGSFFGGVGSGAWEGLYKLLEWSPYIVVGGVMIYGVNEVRLIVYKT